MTDRERMIDIVNNSLARNIDKSCNLAKNIVDDLINEGIIQLPCKVGQIEVVRCKDCKHFKTDTDYCKEHHRGYCEFDNIVKDIKHFCSFGEGKQQ